MSLRPLVARAQAMVQASHKRELENESQCLASILDDADDLAISRLDEPGIDGGIEEGQQRVPVICRVD